MTQAALVVLVFIGAFLIVPDNLVIDLEDVFHPLFPRCLGSRSKPGKRGRPLALAATSEPLLLSFLRPLQPRIEVAGHEALDLRGP